MKTWAPDVARNSTQPRAVPKPAPVPVLSARRIRSPPPLDVIVAVAATLMSWKALSVSDLLVAQLILLLTKMSPFPGPLVPVAMTTLVVKRAVWIPAAVGASIVMSAGSSSSVPALPNGACVSTVPAKLSV